MNSLPPPAPPKKNVENADPKGKMSHVEGFLGVFFQQFNNLIRFHYPCFKPCFILCFSIWCFISFWKRLALLVVSSFGVLAGLLFFLFFVYVIFNIWWGFNVISSIFQYCLLFVFFCCFFSVWWFCILNIVDVFSWVLSCFAFWLSETIHLQYWHSIFRRLYSLLHSFWYCCLFSLLFSQFSFAFWLSVSLFISLYLCLLSRHKFHCFLASLNPSRGWKALHFEHCFLSVIYP